MTAFALADQAHGAERQEETNFPGCGAAHRGRFGMLYTARGGKDSGICRSVGNGRSREGSLHVMDVNSGEFWAGIPSCGGPVTTGRSEEDTPSSPKS